MLHHFSGSGFHSLLPFIKMHVCYFTHNGSGDRGRGAGQPLIEKSRTFSTYRARGPSIHPFPPTLPLTFYFSKHSCL